MSKSGKLYKDSPSLKRDEESGAVGVHKPTPADGENMGVEGGPGLPGGGEGMPVDAQMSDMHGRHEREMSDMHKRHEDEHKDMHKRHHKEAKKMAGGKEEGKE